MTLPSQESFRSGIVSPRRVLGLVGTILTVLLTPRLSDVAAQTVAEQDAEFVEPILTEETMPNELGELTLRANFSYFEHDREQFGSLPQFVIFYGLAERLGASASFPWAFHRGDGKSAYGLGDVELGLKYLLVEHGDKQPAVVFGIEAGFPTGSKSRELGEGAYELKPFLALLKDFGPFTLQGNFGWSKQLNQKREDRFSYNWALAVPLFERSVHLLAEINGDWGSAPQTAIAPGIKYNFTDKLFIGVAAPIGLSKDTPDWGLVMQLQTGF